MTCPSLCSGNGVCSNLGKCVCKPGFAGDDCSTPIKTCPKSKFDHPEVECSGHGACDRVSGSCVCQPGYVGAACDIDDGSCGSLHCSNKGTCRQGVCICDVGFGGEHCEKADKCANDCSGRGKCVGSKCFCNPGFTGKSCEAKEDVAKCPNKCSGNGICSEGKCICLAGFVGADCSVTSSKTSGFCAGNTCSGRGKCIDSQCVCNPGFFGKKCELTGCAQTCVHGTCSLGKCRCEPGWGGAACDEVATCPNDCSGHGVCVKGECVCESFYMGKDCSEVGLESAKCPSSSSSTSSSSGVECSGNGVCHLGACFCAAGFGGVDCGTQISDCPGDCTSPERGICKFGRCHCKPGYDGARCEIEAKCSSRCLKNGLCKNGQCFCKAGYTGPDCDQPLTDAQKQAQLETDVLRAVVHQATGAVGSFSPSSSRASCEKVQCSEHGLCSRGKCLCEVGWSGVFCSTANRAHTKPTTCERDCGENGQCLFGKCFCNPGYTGDRCEKSEFLPCLNDCSSRGVCHLGQCYCHPGFEGADCATERKCKSSCGTHGVCVQGQCECVRGWRGEDCSIEYKEEFKNKPYLNTCGTDGCGIHGVCAAGECYCVEGFKGSRCDVPDASFLRELNPTVSPSAALPGTRIFEIYGNQSCTYCGVRGVCLGGTCVCIPGWAGKTCEIAAEVNSPPGLAGSDLDILHLRPGGQVVEPTPSSFLDAITALNIKDESFLMSPLSEENFRKYEERKREQADKMRLMQVRAASSGGEGESASGLASENEPTMGTDTTVVNAQTAQRESTAYQSSSNTSNSSGYHLPISPYLFAFICFASGLVLATLTKCIVDKAQAESRKKKILGPLLETN